MINTRRWLTPIIAVMVVIQVGGIIRLLQLPDELTQTLSLSRPIAVALGVLWTGLFVWTFTGLIRSGTINRAVMVIVGFIVYSVARLAIFAQADYDRERVPFLVVGAALLVMILVGARLITAYLKQKEMFTYDSKSTD